MSIINYSQLVAAAHQVRTWKSDTRGTYFGYTDIGAAPEYIFTADELMEHHPRLKEVLDTYLVRPHLVSHGRVVIFNGHYVKACQRMWERPCLPQMAIPFSLTGRECLLHTLEEATFTPGIGYLECTGAACVPDVLPSGTRYAAEAFEVRRIRLNIDFLHNHIPELGRKLMLVQSLQLQPGPVQLAYLLTHPGTEVTPSLPSDMTGDTWLS